MSAFHLFGLTHIAALAGLTLVILALVRTGKALTGERQQRFERLVAFLVLALWVTYIGWDWLNGSFDIAYSLPLQLCDFVALVAGFAFVSRNRVLQSLAYFWGLALSTQALISPDVAGRRLRSPLPLSGSTTPLSLVRASMWWRSTASARRCRTCSPHRR